MDCMTISTFRSLEQQAIIQYKEIQRREISHKHETFGQEKTPITILCNIKNEPTIETSTDEIKLNFYA